MSHFITLYQVVSSMDFYDMHENNEDEYGIQ